MVENAFLLELLAGVFFVAASVPLLRLARRTGEVPERLLGIAFLLFGTSYLFYELPYALTDEALLLSFSVIGRVLWDASVVAIALFTKEVFHRDRAWARILVWCVGLLLAVGFSISAIYGDWEGMAPLSNPGFWIEWLGQMIPLAWVACAAFWQYSLARRRVRLGLSDPLVSNRFFLFGLFGLAQIPTVALLIPMYIAYQNEQGFSTAMDLAVGSFEMMTIATIWFAFFPPAIYRSWIEGQRVVPEAGEA